MTRIAADGASRPAIVLSSSHLAATALPRTASAVMTQSSCSRAKAAPSSAAGPIGTPVNTMVRGLPGTPHDWSGSYADLINLMKRLQQIMKTCG